MKLCERPKLVCSGLCLAISKCVEYIVLMYARSYGRNLSIQLYLNVCNLYMILFVNYVQFCPGTYACNLFIP
jgi:hypothetical protein